MCYRDKNKISEPRIYTHMYISSSTLKANVSDS